MRVPIYEEINLTKHDTESILAMLRGKKFGQVPYYITTSDIDQDFLSVALDNISEALITLNVNTRLPYPVYIISGIKRYHPQLTLLESVNHLPNHFYNKVRRLKTKETALLKKTTLLASKIQNENISHKLSELSEIIQPQRKLFELSKELDFYEEILSGLAGKFDDKNKE
jgi:hypothetical protein